MTWTTVWAVLRDGVLAAVDLVLPARCAACQVPAAGVLCRACTDAVRSAAVGARRADQGPRPPPGGMPPCWAGARFEGALRLAVTAYKDEGRRDLRDELACLLAAALAAVASEPSVRRRLELGEDVLVVPVPATRASRRRRGDDPVGDLAVTATAAVNLSWRDWRDWRDRRDRRSGEAGAPAPSSWSPRWCTRGGWRTRRTSAGPRELTTSPARWRWRHRGARSSVVPPACSSTTSSPRAPRWPRRLGRCTTPARGTSSQRPVRRHRAARRPCPCGPQALRLASVHEPRSSEVVRLTPVRH